MPFTFKQFHIDDSQCGMKVSTDAVILGAWAKLPDQGLLLDIGTGSGLLSLMSAQRSQVNIVAIEQDDAAAKAAQANFKASPWNHRIELVHADILQWLDQRQFDAIICNPPWFTSGERSQKGSERAHARHVDSLSHLALLQQVKARLSIHGWASFILPVVEGARFVQLAQQIGLVLQRKMKIHSRAHKTAHRVLLSFSCQSLPLSSSVAENSLLIHDEQGYSTDFCTLTQDFYLNIGSQHR